MKAGERKKGRGVWRQYQRGTETKTQTKARRRQGGKAYERKRNLDPKVYPNHSVQFLYRRPRREVTAYAPPSSRRGKKLS
jgi:hypothetical protein